MGDFERAMQDDHTTIRLYLGAVRRLGIYNPELRVEAVTELMCFVFARDQVLMALDIDGHQVSEDGGHIERQCYRGILPRLLAMDPNEHGWHDLFNVAHSKIESSLISEELIVSSWELSDQASRVACDDYVERREAALAEMRRSAARSLPRRQSHGGVDVEFEEARASGRSSVGAVATQAAA